MNHLPLVIKREYLTKVRNKSFIIMTFMSPMIMIGLVSVVAYLSQLNNENHRTISVLDESGIAQGVFEDFDNMSYHFLENMPLETAKKLVEESSGYGLLYIENDAHMDAISNHIKFYSKETPSLSIISDLESKIQNKLNNLILEKKGVDIELIKNSRTHVTIAQESFAGEASSKVDSIVKLAFGIAVGYLLFMFIIIYGNMIMRSVIEEKTSRIIEVIISSVKPIQLMLGKIIGTSLAGLTQFLVWLLLGGVLLTVISMVFNIDVSQIKSPQQELMQQNMANPEMNGQVHDFMVAFYHLPITNLVFAFILFFIAGYLLYSSLYAAIGAAVDNETDTQQFIWPILVPLMLAVYVGIFTVIEDPHGTVSTVFSFIPFTSPVVMVMRIPFGVPLWQQLVSLLILIGTFMLAVWFAAKIYRVGILMYGKKPSYKELIKWIKY